MVSLKKIVYLIINFEVYYWIIIRKVFEKKYITIGRVFQTSVVIMEKDSFQMFLKSTYFNKLPTETLLQKLNMTWRSSSSMWILPVNWDRTEYFGYPSFPSTFLEILFSQGNFWNGLRESTRVQIIFSYFIWRVKFNRKHHSNLYYQQRITKQQIGKTNGVIYNGSKQ